MVDAEVITLPKICQTFPQLEEPQVLRENVLQTLDTVFKAGTDVVTVEGPDGIGRTTLLAQFALRYPNNSLSLFLSSTSRWTSDPLLLKLDLCNQLHWALYKEEIANLSMIDDSFLGTHIFSLQKQMRRTGEPFYIVIDGLNEIPAGQEGHRKAILELLPLGRAGFKFIFSASSDLRFTEQSKPYILTSFSIEETKRFFAGSALDSDTIADIHKLCRGIPGHLASAKRLLKSGLAPSDFVVSMSDRLVDLFNLEWNRVDTDNNRQLLLLSLIAFDNKPRTLEELSRIANISTAETDNLLKELGFLEIREPAGDVRYVSDTFQRFAAHKLSQHKRAAHELIIDFLKATPEALRTR